MVTENRPLITFFVVGYNHQEFIREAIEAAFAQTYSPLEIILSDDCSTDDTFEVMKDMAASYKGRHTIRLHRQERNDGLASHLNQIAKIARGELFVPSAGDDISMPARTNKIFEAWNQSGRRAMSLFSNARVIDKTRALVNESYFERLASANPEEIRLLHTSGEWSLRISPLSDFPNCMENWVLGATHAYHRNTFEVFGPLSQGVLQEDLVIPLRSQLLGEIIYLDEPLIYYRRYDGNFMPDIMSPEERSRLDERIFRQRLPLNSNRLADLRTCQKKGLKPAKKLRPMIKYLKDQIQRDEVNLMIAEGHRLRGFVRGGFHLFTGVHRQSFFRFLISRYAPKPIARQASKGLLAYRRFKGLAK
jgi:glycosyltransferase involved in cell wall biosynthesis